MFNAIRADLATVWRLRVLVWNMARRDVSVRYAGALGGVFWAYAQPLITVAAYYLVFDIVFAMRMSEGSPTKTVGAYLIVGSLPWMAFCDAIARGASSLVDAGGLLQKNPLPLPVIPARTVLGSAAVYSPLLAMLPVAYLGLHKFSLAVVALIPLIGLQLLLMFLLSYVLAILASALRDTIQIVGFSLSTGIFLSPILFPITLFPSDWQWVLWLNPMTPYVLAYQSILLKGELPDVAVWLAIGLSLFAAFVFVDILIKRSKDQLLDWL